MASLELFSTYQVGNFEENFFFVLCYFVIGRYGHIPVEQTYAVEPQELTYNLLFGSPVQRSIDPDPYWSTIPYHYETVLKDELESSCQEGESDDNNNGNNHVNSNDNDERDNNTVQNNDETVQTLWKAI